MLLFLLFHSALITFEPYFIRKIAKKIYNIHCLKRSGGQLFPK